MLNFAMQVVERPTMRLAGLHIHTDMQKAPLDCSALWEKFVPYMPSLALNGVIVSYGVSVMLSEDTFDYWAAMEIADGQTVPPGLDELTSPAGLYVECRIANLLQLPDAYAYVYTEWLPAQSAYVLNMSAPCYEAYGPDYAEDKPFSLYCPLLPR